MRNRIPVTFVVVVSLFGAIVCLEVGLGFFGTYEVRQYVGQVQALGDSEHVWLVFEIEQRVRRPGLMVEPKMVKLDHFLVVAVISEHGLESSTRVRLPQQPSLKGVAARLFRTEGGLFLLTDYFDLATAALYRWTGEGFQRVCAEEEMWGNLIKKLESVEPSGVTKVLDELTRNSSGQWLGEYSVWEDAEMQWQGDPYFIGVEVSASSTKVVVRKNSRNAPSELTILEYQPLLDTLTYQEYMSLERQVKN